MKKLNYKKKPKVFLLDVEGVMTNGQFIYNSKGKEFKIFGPDDHDGLSLLKQYLKIEFVTGDKSGFKISRKRIVDDMKFKLNLVSTIKRSEWIRKNYDPNDVIYMGDGIFDHYVMKKFSILSHQRCRYKCQKICKLYYKTKWWKQSCCRS